MTTGGEGRAVVYTVEVLRTDPELVIEELHQPDVEVALIVDMTAEHVEGPLDVPVAVVAEAGEFARQLGRRDLDGVLDDLFGAAEAGGGASEPYEIDTRFGRVIDLAGGYGAERSLAMAPTGIRPLGPNAPSIVLLRYRCTNEQHHVVYRASGSTGDACGEALPDGSPCPGILNRF